MDDIEFCTNYSRNDDNLFHVIYFKFPFILHFPFNNIQIVFCSATKNLRGHKGRNSVVFPVCSYAVCSREGGGVSWMGMFFYN